MSEHSHEIIIITTRHDRRYKVPKEELKRVLADLGFEIIRVQRVRRL